MKDIAIWMQSFLVRGIKKCGQWGKRILSMFEEQQRFVWFGMKWKKENVRQGQRGGRELNQVGPYKPWSGVLIFP